MRLKGKVALITGGAHGVEGTLMGIGGAAARLFAREGAAVALADLDLEAAELTAAQIEASGGRAFALSLDVTDEHDWSAAIEAVTDRFGTPNVLVNNAGIAELADVEETTVEIWERHQAVLSRGVWLGTKHVVPAMRAAGGGAIVNVVSIHALAGTPTLAAYHAAKGAARSFTRMAAIQYARDGIRINAIHPGYTLTPMTKPGFDDPVVGPLVMSRIPMARLGRPEEIAAGILFLASDEASYMTGAELVIDGGVTAQ
jgi:3alpha(or 20beta)-hydroxysteroid dehydrogenase/cyclopentanol dehydrogenase